MGAAVAGAGASPLLCTKPSALCTLSRARCPGASCPPGNRAAKRHGAEHDSDDDDDGDGDGGGDGGGWTQVRTEMSHLSRSWQ